MPFGVDASITAAAASRLKRSADRVPWPGRSGDHPHSAASARSAAPTSRAAPIRAAGRPAARRRVRRTHGRRRAATGGSVTATTAHPTSTAAPCRRPSRSAASAALVSSGYRVTPPPARYAAGHERGPVGAVRLATDDDALFPEQRIRKRRDVASESRRRRRRRQPYGGERRRHQRADGREQDRGVGGCGGAAPGCRPTSRRAGAPDPARPGPPTRERVDRAPRRRRSGEQAGAHPQAEVARSPALGSVVAIRHER